MTQNSQFFLSKHKLTIFGISLIVIGIVLYLSYVSIYDKLSLCENYNDDTFLPNTTITVTCKVVGDVGQDLTLRIKFHYNGSIEPIQIPAHLQVKDPNNNLLYDVDFDDKTIISFTPELFGTYTATITSLEDENNRIHHGYTDIEYAFGFLTSYDDVSNPVGNALIWFMPMGEILFLTGIIVLIIHGIKSRKQIHKTSNN